MRTPVRKIAAAAGVLPETAYRYLLQQGAVTTGSARAWEALTSAHVADVAIAALRDAVTLDEGCAILECSQKAFKSLVVSEFIKPLVGRPEQTGSFRMWDRYRRSQLADLRATLTLCSDASSEALVPLSRAIDEVGCELADALGALQSSLLKRIRRDTSKPLLDGLEIDPAELESNLGLGGMLGAANVRKRLQISQYSLKQLAAAEVLPAFTSRRPGTAMFRADDVQRFERRYVSIGKLAAEQGSYIPKVRWMAHRAGWVPAFPRLISETLVFHREAVETIRTEVSGDRPSEMEIEPQIAESQSRSRACVAWTSLSGFDERVNRRYSHFKARYDDGRVRRAGESGNTA